MEINKFTDFINVAGGCKEAAEMLGVTRELIYNIRNGHRQVSFKQAQKIESLTSGRISRKDLRPDIYG